MPYKPKRPCFHSGCGRLAKHGQYCEEHQRLRNRQYNQYERDPETNKRYGQSWRQIRSQYIKAHPLCEECQREGRLVPVEQVHHRIPLAEGGGNDFSNLQSLCKAHHSAHHLRARNRKSSGL